MEEEKSVPVTDADSSGSNEEVDLPGFDEGFQTGGDLARDFALVEDIQRMIEWREAAGPSFYAAVDQLSMRELLAFFRDANTDYLLHLFCLNGDNFEKDGYKLGFFEGAVSELETLQFEQN